MPPVPLNHLGLFDRVNRPEMLLLLVQENRLVHGLVPAWLFLVGGLELVLVVAAVEGHFDKARVRLIGVCVVHWLIRPASAGFTF